MRSDNKTQTVVAGEVISPAPLVVLLIDSNPERAKLVEQGLTANSVVRQASRAGGPELLALIAELQPDVIIIDCDSPDRDTIESLRSVARHNPKPIVMFVEEGDGDLAREAVRAGVSAYIVDGLSSSRVQSVIDVAIERFRLIDALHKELAKSKEDLAARKVIERAKGILMEKRGMTENAAYEAMRSMAMNQGKQLKEVAESIISVTSLLGG
jgi:response regulator NasT